MNARRELDRSAVLIARGRGLMDRDELTTARPVLTEAVAALHSAKGVLCGHRSPDAVKIAQIDSTLQTVRSYIGHLSIEIGEASQ